MHFSALLSVSTLFATALANPRFFVKPNDPDASTLCLTAMNTGGLFHWPRTDWMTWTTSCVPVSSTVVVTSTSTPKTTQTVTTSTTSTKKGPTSTDISTSYTTITRSMTSTAPVYTSTYTVTKTVAAVLTQTIGARTGFIPVQSSLPDPSKADTETKEKRTFKSKVNNSLGNSKFSSLRALIAKLVPGDIGCHVYKEGPCATPIATSTITSTAQTATVTTTSVSTITVTSIPIVSRTTTITSYTTATFTTTRTTTTTSTTTSTTYTSTSTYYAACAPSNTANTLGNEPIDNASIDVDTMRATDDTNVYDCCVSAITDPFGTSFLLADNIGCLVLERDTCLAGTDGVDQSLVKTVYTGSMYPHMTVGNGYCGSFGGYGGDSSGE